MNLRDEYREERMQMAELIAWDQYYSTLNLYAKIICQYANVTFAYDQSILTTSMIKQLGCAHRNSSSCCTMICVPSTRMILLSTLPGSGILAGCVTPTEGEAAPCMLDDIAGC